MLPRPKRFVLPKSNYFIKHCENVRCGVANPAPLGASSNTDGFISYSELAGD